MPVCVSWHFSWSLNHMRGGPQSLLPCPSIRVNVALPPELSGHQHCLDASHAGFVKDFFAVDVVLPLDVHDVAETPLVEQFKELHLFPVKDPGF